MFYVGDILWMEDGDYHSDISDIQNFCGCIRWPNRDMRWYDRGLKQSFQSPVTKEWMPASIGDDGEKRWYDKGDIQSFQDPVTGEWMPALIWADGSKYWYDKGELVRDPETYDWEQGEF